MPHYAAEHKTRQKVARRGVLLDLAHNIVAGRQRPDSLASSRAG
jgi:hypothetical protein